MGAYDCDCDHCADQPSPDEQVLAALLEGNELLRYLVACQPYGGQWLELRGKPVDFCGLYPVRPRMPEPAPTDTAWIDEGMEPV
ncbi:MAG: hypothetical protein JOZ81_06695 [Chloroflexi bacterium]|nr:hypothetical protein [Chloroflexota bacterium]